MATNHSHQGRHGEMGYSFKAVETPQYLLLQISGEANNVKDVLEFAFSALKVAKKKKAHLILMDERTITLNLDQHDVYQCAEILSERFPFLGLRIATLINPSELELFKCFETMFQNRAINYKTFVKLEDAEAWLLA